MMPNLYPLAAATTKPPLQPLAHPLPLVPRIDRLDSIMKILEDEKNVARNSGDLTERKLPMDMAVREAQSQGSLMDRVRSLENRLIQICLEMEPRETSSAQDASVFQVSKDASSNRSEGDDNKKGSSCSSMEFDPTRFYETVNYRLLPKSRVEARKDKAKANSDDSVVKKPARSGKGQKSVATKKKAKHSKWFSLNLFGCS